MANPVAIEKTEGLLQQLRADDGSPAGKAALLRQLDEIRTTLQSPPEIANFYIKKGVALIIINTCLELGVFDAVPPDVPASADDISAKVGIDASILSRFLRALTLEGFFTLIPPAPPQQPVTMYAHTTASLALYNPSTRTSTHFLFRAALTLPLTHLVRAPAYLRNHTAAQTRDPRQNGVAWGMGLSHEHLTFFEALARDKAMAAFWAKAMESREFGGGGFPWGVELRLETMELGEEQGEGLGGRVLVVDVGGGRGRALEGIREACRLEGVPPGEMVLEDLEGVLEGVAGIEGVRKVVYDFFAEGAEQPVKNAHVYYLRRVLHDYYDDHARRILQQVVDAMGPTSRVVLCEYIMPEDNDLGDDIFPYLMDFLLFMVGGLERTEAQWRHLLDSVGLEIVKIWRSTAVPFEADIEVRRKGAR
ncbi:Demethylsterigmatocystin 6-O-methyltransferase [Chaetomidium leptoderma]|uniref:Demethylsterigmatocystin 6-O-methyltransferase n=1 Tax=Chaetomidium leptoderma TaxID=669021 RepID=A0AAN6VJB5_9PEZI|nr:Demethylsterigmatocystin 6-O-methyltransferase [Chaetomidium leptoderma]